MSPVKFYQKQLDSGDTVSLSVIDHDGRESILLSIDDVDGCGFPTIELTVQEFVTLSEEVIRSAGHREAVIS